MRKLYARWRRSKHCLRMLATYGTKHKIVHRKVEVTTPGYLTPTYLACDCGKVFYVEHRSPRQLYWRYLLFSMTCWALAVVWTLARVRGPWLMAFVLVLDLGLAWTIVWAWRQLRQVSDVPAWSSEVEANA